MDSPCVEAVFSLLQREKLLTPQSSLLCAVSGGADSMALLLALCRLRESYGFQLRAAHIQHALRGEASLGDEVFVREWCERWKVPLTVRNAGLHGSMEDVGIEKQARDARRRLFAELLSQDEVLLLAHHRDDQAETVLLHLLRGAGSDGLCGMSPVTTLGGHRLLRPFLELPKEELLSFLASEGVPHREDESNQQTCTARNRLRLQILPMLEALFPGAGRHLAENASILRLEGEELRRQTEAAYRKAYIKEASLFALKRAPMTQWPEALLRRVLRRWVQEAYLLAGAEEDEQTADYAETLALTELVRGGAGGSVNLSHGLKAELGRYLLCLVPQREEGAAAWKPIRPAIGQPIALLDSLWSTRPAQRGEVPSDSFSVLLPPEMANAVLRPPAPGDRFWPLGASGHKEYRRFLTDIRLDRALRPLWPVLALEEEVLWVPGIRSSELLRSDGATGQETLITLREGLLPGILNKGE